MRLTLGVETFLDFYPPSFSFPHPGLSFDRTGRKRRLFLYFHSHRRLPTFAHPAHLIVGEKYRRLAPLQWFSPASFSLSSSGRNYLFFCSGHVSPISPVIDDLSSLVHIVTFGSCESQRMGSFLSEVMPNTHKAFRRSIRLFRYSVTPPSLPRLPLILSTLRSIPFSSQPPKLLDFIPPRVPPPPPLPVGTKKLSSQGRFFPLSIL